MFCQLYKWSYHIFKTAISIRILNLSYTYLWKSITDSGVATQNVTFKGTICNISALKCLKMTIPMLYIFMSCVLTLSQMFPPNVKPREICYFIFRHGTFPLVARQWRHITFHPPVTLTSSEHWHQDDTFRSNCKSYNVTEKKYL